MRLILTAAIAIAMLTEGAAGATPATKNQTTPAKNQTVAGFWQESDSDGNPGGWFLFAEKDGLYEGRIVKMFKHPGDPEQMPTCQKCTGDQKDAPVLGLTIVKDMKRDGRKYEDGTILDPRDGSVYHAEMELSSDGKKLAVRGYIGVPLFGQTQMWTRLPDDVIAPTDVPKESVGPDAAQQ